MQPGLRCGFAIACLEHQTNDSILGGGHALTYIHKWGFVFCSHKSVRVAHCVRTLPRWLQLTPDTTDFETCTNSWAFPSCALAMSSEWLTAQVLPLSGFLKWGAGILCNTAHEKMAVKWCRVRVAPNSNKLTAVPLAFEENVSLWCEFVLWGFHLLKRPREMLG